MSHRVTLGLALLLAIALGGVWVDLRRGPSAADMAPADQVKRILDLDLATVDEIEIVRDEKRVSLRRSDGTWVGGSASNVATLLDALRGLAEILPIDLDSSALADLGLAPPRATIVLRISGRSAAELHVGNRNPAATGLYLQVGTGGRVVLTGALLEWELDKLFAAAHDAPTASPG